MNLKEKMEKFNKRWNIDSTETPEESFEKFKMRILNIYKDIDEHLTDESIKNFCMFYGIIEDWNYSESNGSKWGINVINRINREKNLINLIKLLEVVLSLDLKSTYYRDLGKKYDKDFLFEETLKALDYSNIGVEMVATKEGDVIFYPKGEEKLDNELVNVPLTFLNNESSDHFIQALNFYQSKNHIKSAESLRRSIEEFLRFKLNNKKGLNSNITELQRVLKEEGKDSQVRNIIQSIFGYIDQFFNENSKHNDGEIDDLENEFLIYQTGLLMRYINKTGLQN